MITTGIITAINVSDNGNNNVNYLYDVEISLFQTPGDTDKSNYTYTAAACVPSGINSPFSVGDKVFVGFLYNEISIPIILGKIYNGISDKGNSYGFFNALKVDGTVELPASTKIGNIDYSTLASKFNNMSMLNDLSTVARTGNYNDLSDIPTIKSLLTSISGYDSNKKQVLKNINGTFNWVDDKILVEGNTTEAYAAYGGLANLMATHTIMFIEVQIDNQDCHTQFIPALINKYGSDYSINRQYIDIPRSNDGCIFMQHLGIDINTGTSEVITLSTSFSGKTCDGTIIDNMSDSEREELIMYYTTPYVSKVLFI